MTTKELATIILHCKKAIREEMQGMKRELLSEMKRTQPQIAKSPDKLVETQKSFRQKYQVDQRPKKQFSSNSLLNEMLNSVDPIPNDGSSYLDAFEHEEDIINVPTSESGQPINAPKAVVEAMNRGYSALVQRMDGGKGSNNEKSKQDFRNQILLRMDDDNYNSTDDDDEDLSFLDKL
jgi:hypothetical protein